MIIFDTNDAKLEYQPPKTRQTVPIHGMLVIDSARPVAHITWRVSRGTLIRIALRCLVAALKRG